MYVKRFLPIAAVGLWLGFVGARAAAGEQLPSTPVYALNYVETDIPTLAKTVASMADKTIIVDPRITDSDLLTLVSDRPTSGVQAYYEFGRQLARRGYVILEHRGITKIMRNSGVIGIGG